MSFISNPLSKSILVLFSIFILLSYPTIAQQSKIDSLKGTLENKLSDTIRVRTILDLAKEYTNTSNYTMGMDYALQSISAAEKLMSEKKEYEKFLLKIIATSHNWIGNIYSDKGDYEKALKEYRVALKMREEISDRQGVAGCYNNIGNIYLFQGNYGHALQNYLRSLKIMEKLKDKNGIATSHTNIGNIYYYQGDYERALESYRKTIGLYIATNDKIGLSSIYDNIGNIFLEESKFDLALEYGLKSVVIRKEIEDKVGLANSYSNIGNIYMNQNIYDKALENQLLALNIREEIGDKQGLANSFLNLGVINKEQNDFKGAENYFNQSLEICKSIGFKEGVKEAYSMLSNLFEKKKEFSKALEYRKLYYAIKDSLMNENTKREMADINGKYESEKRDLELIKKNTEVVVQKAQIKEQAFQRDAFIMGFALVLGFAIFLFYGYRQKKKTNENLEKIIAERTSELQFQNKQKELMLQEIHHRVKNNLQLITSLLRLQVSFKGDKNVDEILDNCADRIKCMAILHDKLYKENNFSEINTLDYFTELTNYVSRNYNSSMGRAKIELNVIPINLPINKLIPCGLVLNELVSNAYKYAFTSDSDNSTIDISFSKKTNEDSYLLTISDNGKGFPENFNAYDHSGLGLTIVQSLVEQLDGKISFSHAGRTMIDISFPS